MNVLTNKLTTETAVNAEHPITVVLSAAELKILTSECALIPDKTFSLPIKISVGDSVVEAAVPIKLSVSRSAYDIDFPIEGDDCHGEALGW